MGWLRDFMSTADPAIPSFGQLAQRCLDHEGWPEESRPKYRSLSTLFSKLDRGTDLDWLRDRTAVQKVLAHLLGRPLADIRTAIGETSRPSDARFLRLVDVRFAREIDLAREPLPPGLPTLALDPPSWNFTWWYAPSGSGRTVTSLWLRARGLAHAALIRERDDLARLPPRGPLFLEIASSATRETLSLTRDDFEALRVGARPILVAAGFADPGWGAGALTSPRVEEYLPELIDWIFSRLDEENSHFEPNRVETWMRKVALPAGAISTWGDALGILGMTDEVPVRSLLSRSLDEIGAHFVERRLREIVDEVGIGARVIPATFDALSDCAARVLVDGRHSLTDARPSDEWTALLASSREEDSPDPQWFTAALDGTLGTQISRRDLRRAAKRLPPSAFQLTRALEAAQLLVSTSALTPTEQKDEERCLRPTWLTSLLSARAFQRALRFHAEQWGRILFVGRDADRVVRQLIRSALHEDFSAFFDLVDHYDPESPAHAAALEGSIIALGFASLEGCELPEELVVGLLSLLADELFLLARLPEPRLASTSQSASVFCRSTFLVGFAALCQLVPFPLVHYDPLRHAADPLRDHFATACEAVTRMQWPNIALRAGLLRLLDALFSDTPNRQHPAVGVVRSLDSTSPDEIQRALASFPAEALVLVAEQYGITSSSAYDSLWRYAGTIRSPGSIFLTEEGERDFWRHVPLEVLRSRVQEGKSIAWNTLLPHQFAAWFAAQDPPPLPPEAVDKLPMEHALQVIAERGTQLLDDAALTLFLERATAGFAPLLGGYFHASDDTELERVLRLAPSRASAALAGALPPAAELLRMSPSQVHLVRDFLTHAIRERHPQFEQCYRILLSIERGVGPLRQLT